jgi:hypothetical protein
MAAADLLKKNKALVSVAEAETPALMNVGG